MKKLIFITVLIYSGVLLATETINPALKSFLEFLGPVLGDFAVKYPWMGKFLTVTLWTRLIVKPLMSAILTIGQDMPEGGVRKTLRAMSGHWAYKVVAYLLDWFGSVKLPKK